MLDALSIAESAPTAVFLAFFVGTFISEDATCLLAGAAVAAGETSFALAVSACLTGIFAGDLMLYGLGRFFGPAVFRLRLVRRLISDETRERAERWLGRNVGVAVFTSRFVSGLRLPVYLTSGAMKADPAKFTLWFLIAAAVWTPLLVGAAAFSVTLLSPGNLLVGFAIVMIVVQLIRHLSSWTKRRLVIGKLKRLVNWEFWPLPVFYAPVALYVVWLGIRHRGVTVFTGANPGIPAGGFVGESKSQIYELIKTSPHLPRYTKIDASRTLLARLLSAVAFIVENKLTFPIVVKPDIGERGKGVRIVRGVSELVHAVKTSDRDLIIQEYYNGVEASVFYYRMPHEERGQIFSITEKEFPFVTGDGESTVKDLILSDQRAVCLAKNYFHEQSCQLDRVPRKAERVQLIDIGTHSRGAIFRDGEWLRTPQLEKTIDEISRRIDGFYFGRYDLKAPSFDALMRGKFRIIELNGVTSESTNIYDPKFSLVDAYRILFRQWRLACEIGAANRDRGIRTLELRAFASLLLSRDASRLTDPLSATLLTASDQKSCA